VVCYIPCLFARMQSLWFYCSCPLSIVHVAFFRCVYISQVCLHYPLNPARKFHR
jgi:hypothetical protein